ncbi:hypothetical protein GGI04_006061, partial [Coemansia thaxteri]
MIDHGAIDPPSYWCSLSGRTQVGLWRFNATRLPSLDAPVEETALFTLLDDATAELAARIALAHNTLDNPVGFTANLNITKTGASPTARLFYYEASMTQSSSRKIVIECPLFDAETGVCLMVARGVFVFMEFDTLTKQLRNTTNSLDDAVDTRPTPIALHDGCELDGADLYGLSQVMNFLPHGTVQHSGGLLSRTKRLVLVQLDFGHSLSGPPIYVHGGVLGTVLYNVSALLFSKIMDVPADAANAATRDINYHKGVPLEFKACTIEARIESSGASQTVVVAKLAQGKQVYTSLKTTFILPHSA